MKEINLHKLRHIIGAKAISSAKILISTLSENESALDFHFPVNEALQLNEYLGMAIKQIGWFVPDQVSNQIHRVPDQVYEIRITGGIYITDDVNFSLTMQPDVPLNFTLSFRESVRLSCLIDMVSKEQGWIPLGERCYYTEHGHRCQLPRKGTSNFCEQHRNKFSNIENKHILNMAADMFKRTLTVNNDKKIAPSGDMTAFAEFTNCLNELVSRGYTQKEATECIGELAKSKGVFDDFDTKIGTEPKWKKFEKLILGIHLLKREGAEIKLDDHITGKRSKRQRQIDISLRFNQGYYDYLAVVECKDTLVTIDMVESFKTKLEDVGAHRGIIATSKGYQSGAVEAAKAYAIELCKLSEETTDWTVKVRENVHELPFPTNIELDHDPVHQEQQVQPSYILWRELIFVDEKGEGTNLAEIIADSCKWAHERNIDLPCIINLKFGMGMRFCIPSSSTAIPIYGLQITLERHHLKIKQSVDLPPKVDKYIYSDVNGIHKIEVKASEIAMAAASYSQK